MSEGLVREARVSVNEADYTKKISEVREQLVQDMTSGDLLQLQLKVDSLVKLAALAGEHHHDSTGGVGHHDHSSLADLSWRLLERPSIIETTGKTSK